jgi:hypothetical protein
MKYDFQLPDDIREDDALMLSLDKFVGNIYSQVGAGVNPYYKIVEILQRNNIQDRLEYNDLEMIDEYYNASIIDYLTKGGRGEYYTKRPCNNRKELKSSLSLRNNCTDGQTLRNIISNMN